MWHRQDTKIPHRLNQRKAGRDRGGWIKALAIRAFPLRTSWDAIETADALPAGLFFGNQGVVHVAQHGYKLIGFVVAEKISDLAAVG